MDFKDVMAFARENPVCTMATMDGDQPRVRGLLSVFFDDDDRIYFTTAATKNFFKQLEKNPKAEICYFSKTYTMMRIACEIEVIDDRAKKQKLIEEKDYLKGFSADDPVFKLLRVKNGKARFWTLERNLKEDKLEVIEI